MGAPGQRWKRVGQCVDGDAHSAFSVRRPYLVVVPGQKVHEKQPNSPFCAEKGAIHHYAAK